MVATYIADMDAVYQAEGVYRGACALVGDSRYGAFNELSTQADVIAAAWIYAPEAGCSDRYKVGYCNLMHNYNNALTVILGMQWRIEHNLYKRNGGPDYVRLEIEAIIERNYRVCVENGASVLEMFRDLFGMAEQCAA